MPVKPAVPLAAMPLAAMPLAAVSLAAAVLLALGASASAQQETLVPPTQPPNPAAGLAGTWELAANDRSEACRLMLRAERSDKGDYFLGMPPACRHAMPALAKVGRWGIPDGAHVTLDEPSGAPVLILVASGYGYAGRDGNRAYTLTRIGAASPADVAPLEGPAIAIVPVVRRKPQAEPAEQAAPMARDKPADIAGRYAVMREKHDTGCMLTLDDKTRGKAGGDRAQLAPGCRDQGIVIFDPVGWRLVKGAMVLTARAGHSTKLDKVDDGKWAKDAQDGGKPLGLKKL